MVLDVANGARAVAKLRALGVRSVAPIAKGEQFMSAQRFKGGTGFVRLQGSIPVGQPPILPVVSWCHICRGQQSVRPLSERSTWHP